MAEITTQVLGKSAIHINRQLNLTFIAIAPTWNALPDYKFNPNPFFLPYDGQSAAYKHRVLWRGVWDWLHGIPLEPGVAKW